MNSEIKSYFTAYFKSLAVYGMPRIARLLNRFSHLNHLSFSSRHSSGPRSDEHRLASFCAITVVTLRRQGLAKIYVVSKSGWELLAKKTHWSFVHFLFISSLASPVTSKAFVTDTSSQHLCVCGICIVCGRLKWQSLTKTFCVPF